MRVTEHPLPPDTSGMFLHGREIGAVVVVNERHAPTRRQFSCAHEYCHVLVDRARAATISRAENRDELAEVRANVFAAHFLMPEAGVRAFLQTIGKGEATRQVQEVFDGAGAVHEALPAQRRAPPGAQNVQLPDVVRLAHYFGVSYEAALFHLLNLKVLAKDAFEHLRERQGAVAQVRRALALPDSEEQEPQRRWSLAEHIVALGFEGFRRDLISRAKLLELAEAAGVDRGAIENAIESLDREDPPADVVRPA